MRISLAKYNAIAQATPRMTRKQVQAWKGRQMMALRLEQAREARAAGSTAEHDYFVKSALRWRQHRNKFAA